MKFKIRHETPLFPVMEFFSSVMNSNSRHEIILRHESLYDGMKAIIFRHEILYPPSWIRTFRHESNCLLRNEI